MWKIVGASEASVLYIYIDNNRSAFVGQRDVQWAWGLNCSLLTWASLLG